MGGRDTLFLSRTDFSNVCGSWLYSRVLAGIGWGHRSSYDWLMVVLVGFHCKTSSAVNCGMVQPKPATTAETSACGRGTRSIWPRSSIKGSFLIFVRPPVSVFTVCVHQRNEFPVSTWHLQALFTNCVVDSWNHLPTDVIPATSLNYFKCRLDKINLCFN